MQDDAVQGGQVRENRTDGVGLAPGADHEGGSGQRRSDADQWDSDSDRRPGGSGKRPADNDQPKTPARRSAALLRELLILLAVALTIALALKALVVQPFYIPSGSMENTLLVGDKVLVNRFVYHVRPIERGDIVVFNGQGSWDPPAKPARPSSNPLGRLYDATLGRLVGWAKGLFGTAPGQVDYVKRVIGLPGDHVVCCNARGQITVNGVPVRENSYLPSGVQPSQFPFNVVVPPGRLWVMGDNRMYSADSRLHDCQYSDPETSCVRYDRDGTIPEDKVIGRAFMIIWPLNRARVLANPPVFSRLAPRSTASAVLGFAVATPVIALGRWRLRSRRRRRRIGG